MTHTKKQLTLNSLWRSYRIDVVPQEAEPIQVSECKKAFYMGAGALLRLILETDEDPDLPLKVYAEIEQFANQLVEAEQHG